jgi:hypothetical protein
VKSALLICVATLLLAGCPLSQLNDLKKDEGDKNYSAIENTSIDSTCAGSGQGSAACAQASEIQGRACLTLAQQEAAPNAACPPDTATAQRRLKCAATDLDAARLGRQFPPDQLIELGEMHARALYCGATLKSRSDGLPDAREAARELELPSLPPSARREQLAAASELYVANSDQLSNAERCSAALRAIARADRGLQESPDDNMKQGLQATRAHASSVAGHLTGCPTS